MRFNRSYRRCGCTRCCSRCNGQTDTSAQVYTLYSLHRFIDVPMRVYYGSGYSQQQTLESIDQSLSTLADCADTLQSNMQQHRNGCC